SPEGPTRVPPPPAPRPRGSRQSRLPAGAEGATSDSSPELHLHVRVGLAGQVEEPFARLLTLDTYSHLLPTMQKRAPDVNGTIGHPLGGPAPGLRAISRRSRRDPPSWRRLPTPAATRSSLRRSIAWQDSLSVETWGPASRALAGPAEEVLVR